MIRNTLFIAVITSLIILAGSCSDSWFNCLEGNGVQASEDRTITAFSGIEHEGNFEVVVTYGSSCSVTVEADENLLPYIITSRHGSRLVIETERGRCIQSRNPVIVYVTMPYADHLELTGSGSIDCSQVDTDYLHILLSGSGEIIADILAQNVEADLTGSGIIELYGEMDRGDLKITGSGYITTYNCVSKNCFVTISGSGDVYTLVDDLLDVKITGSGTVYYRGNPVIRSSITGSGQVLYDN